MVFAFYFALGGILGKGKRQEGGEASTPSLLVSSEQARRGLGQQQSPFHLVASWRGCTVIRVPIPPAPLGVSRHLNPPPSGERHFSCKTMTVLCIPIQSFGTEISSSASANVGVKGVWDSWLCDSPRVPALRHHRMATGLEASPKEWLGTCSRMRSAFNAYAGLASTVNTKHIHSAVTCKTACSLSSEKCHLKAGEPHPFWLRSAAGVHAAKGSLPKDDSTGGAVFHEQALR